MSDLTVHRSLLTDTQRVWEALTEPERVSAWIWPERFATDTEIDLASGYRIASPTVGMAVSGAYRYVDAPHSLVQTWRWDGEEYETLVTFTLDPTVGLTVTHEGFPTAEDAAHHVQGWNDCLDRLETYLLA